MKYNIRKVVFMFAAIAVAIAAKAQDPSLDNGIKMYNYKKFQSAERILAPLAASSANANYFLGLTYLNEGDPAKAETTFAKFPDDPANVSGMARVAFARKNPAQGMTIAKGLAAKGKKKDWIQEKYAAEAITYSEGGDYQQAIAWYKDALIKSDNAEMHIGLGDAYRKIPGGGGEAMNNYESVTDKDAKNSLAFSRIGDLWYEARNYQSALENYAKAKDADASNPLPYKALADAYNRSGKYKLGLENLKKYLELSDNTNDDKMTYARALYLGQSYCDAAKLAEELLRQQSDPARKTELSGILGYSQAECGDSVQALKNLRYYMQMQDPKKILPGDYIQIGKLFMKLGQLDSAGVYYNKGIAGDTAQNKTDIYRQIAEALKSKKEYCKSAEWYNNLVKANPETQPADYVWRGIMYYYCKDYNSAMRSFNEFAAKYADQPSAPYWQGRTAAAIDSEATSGAGVPYYTKWLDVVGGDKYEKKNDLKGAYEYMLYYFYNKKDKDNIKVYKEKIRAIDPNDRVLHDIEEMEKSPAAPPKKQPAKK